MKTKHSDYKNKDKSLFDRKPESLNKTRSIFVKKCRTENENLTDASCRASYHISHHVEAHIIGESQVGPILKDVVSCIFDEKSAQAVESISLSNNTVWWPIADIEDKLISQLYVCDACALQIDESTDVAELAIIFAFARYDFSSKN